MEDERAILGYIEKRNVNGCRSGVAKKRKEHQGRQKGN